MLRTSVVGACALSATLAFWPQPAEVGPGGSDQAAVPVGVGSSHAETARPSTAQLDDVVDRYCVRCHSERRLTGNLSLEDFVLDGAEEWPETTEKVIGKLRLSMMPPSGARRPGGDTLQALAEALEERIDDSADDQPNLVRRGFQRLNRAEYASSVRDLIGLEIDPGAYLPPDTRSDNFDNIADVQMPSATVMDAYLTAAAEISRKAVGDPNATSTQTTYSVPRTVSQTVHIEGTPRGTRGGLARLHTFPADGEYVFRASFYTTLTGTFFGRTARDEQLEIAVDGERVAVIDVDRFILQSDPTGEWMQSDPVFIPAGQHRLSASFVKRFEGPAEDIVSPIRESLADLQVGYADGMTLLPHLWELVVEGPSRVTGVSDNAIRRRIFTCRPTSPANEAECARSILQRLATRAYRRALTEEDVALLMRFYEDGVAEGGFEVGVRTGLQTILSSPDFLFRIETAEPASGEVYRIGDRALASRLSYFLWGAPPDEELLDLAEREELHDEEELARQVRRMLADPRAEALASRFAAQWLRLQDLEKVHPDSDLWPDFEGTLRDAMRMETELFVQELVREDRSVLDLLTADFTYVNEPLARHYGLPGVSGAHFRRVELPDTHRRGLLGQGSILVSTSHADRTSPVLRGKWIMEVLLDNPPPPPPPNVPELESTAGVRDGRMLTLKERMEVHRANPACNSCHSLIDPIGLALENFDVTGEWRIKDSGSPIDPSGTLWDGRPSSGPESLREALLDYRVPFLRAFTKNLMAYGIGRRVAYGDQPTIRRIVSEAEGDGYRWSDFVVGVVLSDPFRFRPAPGTAQEARGDG